MSAIGGGNVSINVSGFSDPFAFVCGVAGQSCCGALDIFCSDVYDPITGQNGDCFTSVSSPYFCDAGFSCNEGTVTCVSSNYSSLFTNVSGLPYVLDGNVSGFGVGNLSICRRGLFDRMNASFFLGCEQARVSSNAPTSSLDKCVISFGLKFEDRKLRIRHKKSASNGSAFYFQVNLY